MNHCIEITDSKAKSKEELAHWLERWLGDMQFELHISDNYETGEYLLGHRMDCDVIVAVAECDEWPSEYAIVIRPKDSRDWHRARALCDLLVVLLIQHEMSVWQTAWPNGLAGRPVRFRLCLAESNGGRVVSLMRDQP